MFCGVLQCFTVFFENFRKQKQSLHGICCTEILSTNQASKRQFRRPLLFAEHNFAALGVHNDAVAVVQRANKQLFGKGVFHLALNGAF